MRRSRFSLAQSMHSSENLACAGLNSTPSISGMLCCAVAMHRVRIVSLIFQSVTMYSLPASASLAHRPKQQMMMIAHTVRE